ncbi:hypothetical protein M0R45_024137 [Rubus argutus]|uniref:Fumarate lyase N-terminal domain-containing protein n=1 Tax=Rubus argutus TaxID=59490 RepID=A0AAW1WS74_RUBAR
MSSKCTTPILDLNTFRFMDVGVSSRVLNFSPLPPKSQRPIDPSSFYLHPILPMLPCRSFARIALSAAAADKDGEYGLIYYRVLVEIKWLLKLSQIPEVIEVPNFSEDAQSYLQGIIDGFSIKDAREVKRIEVITNHDVKAVEYFLKQRSSSHPEIAKVLEFYHFACTSEDINNIAHALMLTESINNVLLPVMDDLIRAICVMAKENASFPCFRALTDRRPHPQLWGRKWLFSLSG